MLPFPLSPRTAHVVLICLTFSLLSLCMIAMAATDTLSDAPSSARLLAVEAVRAADGSNVAANRPLSVEVGAAGRGNASSAMPIIALLDFQSSTLNSGEQQALTQALWARMHKLGGVSLMPRHPTRGWLIRNDLHPPTTPYQQPVSPARVVEALRADYLITGHVDDIQGHFVVDYSVFSQRAGEPIRQDVEFRRVNLERMLSDFEALAAELRDVALADHLGLPLEAFARTRGRSMASVAPAALHKRPSGLSKQRLSEEVVLEAPGETSPPPDRHPEPEPLATEVIAEAHMTPEPPLQTEPVATIELPVPEHEPVEQLLAEVREPPAEPAGEVHAPAETAERPDPEPVETTAHEEPAKTLTEEAPPPVEAEEIPKASPRPPASGDKTDIQEEARRLYESALTIERLSQERLDMLIQASKMDPEENLFHRMLANEYYNRELYEECIIHCDKALGRHPKDSMLLTIKASALFNLNKMPEARKANEAAIAASPDNLWAHYNLGLTLTMMEAEEAAGAWHRYLNKAKDDPTHNDLGLVEDARQRLAELQTPSN